MDTAPVSQGATAPAQPGPPSVAFSFSELANQSHTAPEPKASPSPEPEKEAPSVDPDVADDVAAARPDIKELLTPKEKKAPEKLAVKKPTDKKPERTFEIQSGENKFSLKPEAQLQVKIDGKFETRTLQEVVDNYSGKVAYDRKFEDLASQKKGLQDTINALYDNFVTKGDALTGIEVLAEALGANPFETRRQLTETLLKQVDSLATLSPEQRETAKIREELEYRRRREESDKVTSAKKQELSALEARVTKVQETHGLNREQMVQIWTELQSLNVPQDQITPEFMGDYHKAKELRSGIDNLLTETEAEFESDEEKTGAIEKLQKVMQLYPDMTLTELRDHVLEAYGSKSAKNLARKLKKSQPVSTTRTPERIKEPITFDDLG